MGNQCSQPDRLASLQLKRYGDATHPFAGKVTVFKNQVLPYYFVMKVNQTDFDQSKLTLYDKLKQCDSEFIIRLYGWQRQYAQCHGHASKESISSYWDYFTFTFEAHVKRKAAKLAPFQESQLWYILRAACDIDEIASLVNFESGLFDFSPSYIYLSTEGFFKLNILESLRRYSRMFQTRRLYPSFPSPQQLDYLQQLVRKAPQSFRKITTFSVGMIVLSVSETMTGLDLKQAFNKYYDEQTYTIKQYEINKTLVSMRDHYSKQLVDLIYKCLNVNPAFRPSLSWVLANYPQLNKFDGIELQIIESEQKTIESSESSAYGTKREQNQTSKKSTSKGYYLKKLIQSSK